MTMPSDDMRKLAETCPICQRPYLPDRIAQHVQDHLDHDVIELRLGGSRPGLYIAGNKVRTAR